MLGWFNMGSTVIVLAAGDTLEWLPALEPGRKVRQGEAIGDTFPGRSP
ncbi:MAG: phosphatidylserine decarboxylase [Pseudomonadota bacterium]